MPQPVTPIPPNEQAQAALQRMPVHRPTGAAADRLPPGASMRRNEDAYVGITDTGEICGTSTSEEDAINAVRWRMGLDNDHDQNT